MEIEQKVGWICLLVIAGLTFVGLAIGVFLQAYILAWGALGLGAGLLFSAAVVDARL